MIPTDEARAVLAIVVAFGAGTAVVRTSRVVQDECVRLAREGT